VSEHCEQASELTEGSFSGVIIDDIGEGPCLFLYMHNFSILSKEKSKTYSCLRLKTVLSFMFYKVGFCAEFIMLEFLPAPPTASIRLTDDSTYMGGGGAAFQILKENLKLPKSYFVAYERRK
jgi:hypothetical protein